jgi:putative ABC transport system permease protein
LPAYTSLYQGILRGLERIPGVAGAAGTRVIPYGGMGAIRAPQPLTLDGQSGAEQERNPLVRRITISPDYFRVAGIPLLRGRPFAEEETQASPRVAIVSEVAAKRLWPGAEALGQRVKPGPAHAAGDWHTVVGVVGDVKYGGLNLEPEPTVYFPYTQTTAGDFHLLVRTRGAPLQWAAAVQREIWRVDPDLAIYSLRAMSSILAGSIWQQRLWSAVFSAFAVVAVSLALIGVHGVLAWSVRQRSRELGIRVALGAPRRAVIALVLREGMRPALVGLAGGVLAAVLLTRALSSLLFGIAAGDPLTWSGALVLLSLVCLLACYLPARRAARVDPVVVLKQS